jgi:hypothetical protein
MCIRMSLALGVFTGLGTSTWPHLGFLLMWHQRFPGRKVKSWNLSNHSELSCVLKTLATEQVQPGPWGVYNLKEEHKLIIEAWERVRHMTSDSRLCSKEVVLQSAQKGLEGSTEKWLRWTRKTKKREHLMCIVTGQILNIGNWKIGRRANSLFLKSRQKDFSSLRKDGLVKVTFRVWVKLI